MWKLYYLVNLDWVTFGSLTFPVLIPGYFKIHSLPDPSLWIDITLNSSSSFPLVLDLGWTHMREYSCTEILVHVKILEWHQCGRKNKMSNPRKKLYSNEVQWKTSQDRKTLPGVHFIGCRGVKLFLLKKTFFKVWLESEFCIILRLWVVTIWVFEVFHHFF